eukprot:123535-Amphidinium_carterae.1
MQQVHEIPDELIWNIDEANTRLLPLGEHGWAHKKENAQASSVLEAGAGYKVNRSLATNKPKLPHWVATALEH